MAEKGVSEGGKKDQAYKLDFWWKIETTTLSLPFMPLVMGGLKNDVLVPENCWPL